MKRPLYELVLSKRQEIIDTAARRGAHNVRLFGSVARGDEIPESDIDFLVDLEPDRDIFDLGGLLMDLTRLLGHEADVINESSLRKSIRSNVLRDVVLL